MISLQNEEKRRGGSKKMGECWEILARGLTHRKIAAGVNEAQGCEPGQAMRARWEISLS